MTTRAIIVTGAQGEIGKGIIATLAQQNDAVVLAVDLNAPEQSSTDKIKHIKGDILNPELFATLGNNYSIQTIYHLAALLSSSGERDPERAHKVNVEGSLSLLTFARLQSEKNKSPVTFVFPSTIAIYGVSENDPNPGRPIKETDCLEPITMYGCNKLYVENLGRYFTNNYRMFEGDRTRVDFRCVRLPGVLCADTVPTGGTSDYGPEMVHAAAQGKYYECFVTPEARLPFIVKPDAIKALTTIAKAPRSALKQSVYNVSSFSPSATEIRDEVRKFYPTAEVSFKPHPERNRIVHSWPRVSDDSAARRDWGWSPDYSMERAFKEYLIPGVQKRYSK